MASDGSYSMIIDGEEGTVIGKKRMNRRDDEVYVEDFIDIVSPSIIQLEIDHYVRGNAYRCAWAPREHPTSTEEQVILRNLGEKDGVTLRIYTWQISPAEGRKIISNAANKNRMWQGSTENLQDTITAGNNLQGAADIVLQTHRNKEPFLHTAVYIEPTAADPEQFKLLQMEALTKLVCSKLNVDCLFIRQKQGFLSVMPSGWNVLRKQYERVLPASSVVNLYPFHYSGKTDPNGFYLGRDKSGSNIIVGSSRHAEDKTNANILILGNSGQGKSYLLKLTLCTMREAGMDVICPDPEGEYQDLAENLGGCYIDLMIGEYKINLLQTRCQDENGSPDGIGAPTAFRQTSRLNQHISSLKDFLRSHKDFTDQYIGAIEIMVGRLYGRFGFTDRTDFKRLNSTDYPILSDLYQLTEGEYQGFDDTRCQLFTAEPFREVPLGFHSICRGVEAPLLDGHTNTTDSHFIALGVRGLLQASKNVRNVTLFNILSYMSDTFLTNGRTVASIDESYLFLSDLTAAEYARNFMKWVRKKDSAVILSSRNLEDYNLPGIAEYTKPFFAIPTHSFLFNAGAVDAGFHMDTLQLEKSEYNLVQYPRRGVRLYRCGNERYSLMVQTPPYKARPFGKAGGR